MQRDFIDGTLGTPEAAAIVDNVVARINASLGELILFTQDTHNEDYLNTPEGKKLPVIHCVENTEGWEINPAIYNAWRNNPNTIISREIIENTFTKPIFSSTALVEFLAARQNEINNIEILGLCTDICVISNAIMIKNALPSINISVNAACCAGVTPQSHQEALNIMKMCQIDII
jgi:nicotinamidase-related amidase